VIPAVVGATVNKSITKLEDPIRILESKLFTLFPGVLLMRLTRFITLVIGFAAFTACSSDDVFDPSTPPIASVRFINAVTDTGAVDITMIDQINWSAKALNLAFRAGTAYWPTEAKSRHIRVFPTSRSIGVTSVMLLDTQVDIAANTRVTLLLTGSARAGTLRFVTIDDGPTAPAAGQIGVRLVNASGGAVDAYLVAATTDPITGAPFAANVASNAASTYAGRGPGAAAVRATDAGSATVTASQAGPAAAATLPGELPAAGVTAAGTAFSVYYFPRGVAGSPNNAITTPGMVWFVDRNPAD
jgi:uncharacterized protein DUF4397